MAKYETEQQTKIVNSYGGIGSLIQTRENGSLLIENFDKWLYFSANFTGTVLESSDKRLIQDSRLVVRLREEAFNNIMGLFRMPENEFQYGMTSVESPNNVITARFFPEWFFCPVCRQLKHLRTWQDGDNNNNYYPVCKCNNEHGNRLEQIRFILVSRSGEMCDIPWDKFFNEAGNEITVNPENTQPNAIYSLFISVGGSGETLESIKITNYDKNENVLIAGTVKKLKSLGRLNTVRFLDIDENEYSVQVRQSNSICYVKTISSVFIPKVVIPPDELNVIRTIRQVMPDANAQYICQQIRIQNPGTSTTVEMIDKHLKPAEDNDIEDTYRAEEFLFFNRQESDEKDLKFKRIPLEKYCISNLYQIRKLKVTVVQTHYSRLTPEGTLITVGPEDARYLPAVEMYGEGILIQFDSEKLENLLNQIAPEKELPQNAKLLVHTFSHIIMKELEFECGYSLSSLKERLYVVENNYATLIYAVSGSDSSMGGLTALFERIPGQAEIKIDILIANAIQRAKDCANDPICSGTKNENQNNEAACYSCSLIPEISCEEFNKSLNRNLLNIFFRTLQ